MRVFARQACEGRDSIVVAVGGREVLRIKLLSNGERNVRIGVRAFPEIAVRRLEAADDIDLLPDDVQAGRKEEIA